jgi:hypothetical protein
MNINPEFQSPERPNFEDVMAEGMDFLFKKFILPETKKLDQDDLETVALIGIAFKDIASQAEAYYQLQEQGYEKNPNSLN